MPNSPAMLRTARSGSTKAHWDGNAGVSAVFDLPENHPLRIAHKKSLFNRAEIEASQQCGCFYCKKIFGPDQIVNWADPNKPRAQQTAVCPECGIDSVIGNASGLEITEAFLEEMRAAWFGEIAPH